MAIFRVLKHWRQPKYPTIRECLNKAWAVETLGSSVAIIKNNGKYVEYVLQCVMDKIMSHKEFRESNIICIPLQ